MLAPGSHTVSVDVTRGRRTYATGNAVVRSGVAHVRLRALRRIRHGRYLITIVTGTGTKVTVARHYQRL